MSYVTMYAIDRDGRLESAGEVHNAWRFHMAIWDGLMKVHGILGGTMSRDGTERLWRKLYEMVRHDQLIMLATFDRVWFPYKGGLVGELILHLKSESRFHSSACEVAKILSAIDPDGAIGVGFSTSQASTWTCPSADDEHVLDVAACRCKVCGTPLQNAAHVLERRPCCKEHT